METVFCRIVAIITKSAENTGALQDAPGENSKTGKKRSRVGCRGMRSTHERDRYD